MKSGIRLLLAAALCSSVLPAQALVDTLYFSSRFTEVPQSGRGGDINSGAPTCVPPPVFGAGIALESATANSPGVCYVEPGVNNIVIPTSPSPGTHTVDYVEVVNFPQFNLIIGDLDGDLLGSEPDNFRGVDALYIPYAVYGRRNTIHEMFVSTYQNSVGNQGFIQDMITEADMVLLPAATNVYPAPSGATAPVYFVRRADWEAFLGLSPGLATIDVDAFTVDQATGDIYVSFENTIQNARLISTNGGAVASATIDRGDVIRIPGGAYTPSGPYSVVTNPQVDMAELVLPNAEVSQIVTGSGGTFSGGVNVIGLDLDPAGFVHTSTTLFPIPNLIFTIYATGGSAAGPHNAMAAAIYSTQGGGGIAFINGTVMNHPNAVGFRSTSFNPSFWAGCLDALEVVHHPSPLDPYFHKPFHLDTFPDSGLGLAGPQTLVGYLSGAFPGSQIWVFGRIDVLGAGGFVTRWSTPFLTGFPDLYVDVLGLANLNTIITPAPFAPLAPLSPIGNALFNYQVNPITPATDPINGSVNGDTCFELVLPAVPPSVPPLLLTMQAIEIGTFRVSTPLGFQFN